METLFIGKNLLFLHEVESTNTYAMDMLRNVNAIEGTVIYTNHQTKGKGQRGALWHSNNGQNIAMSLILKPHFLDPKNVFYLSKISALATYDVMTELLPNSHFDIKIKWPNDILVNQKKIAGILIENNYNGNSIQHSIIGIGMNVNQTNFENYEREATSLQSLMGKDFDRKFILNKLCSTIEKWYFKLKENKLSEIDESYLKALLGLNQKLQFTDSNNKQFEGKITGVSLQGKLKIELNDLLEKEFDIKELKFLL